jgi:hypothetical protein
MKKYVKILIAILGILTLIFAEYRFIMCNLKPYVAEDTIYIELFDQVDVYDFEEWSD